MICANILLPSSAAVADYHPPGRFPSVGRPEILVRGRFCNVATEMKSSMKNHISSKQRQFTEETTEFREQAFSVVRS